MENALPVLRLLSIGCSNYTPLVQVLTRAATDDVRFDVAQAPYGQVFPTLLNEAADLWQPPPDVTLVWTRPERVLPGFAALLAGEDVAWERLASDVDAFVAAVRAGADRTVRLTLVTTWAQPPTERGLGVADWTTPGGIASTLARLNLRLADALADRRDVLLLDTARWLAAAGPRAADPKLWMMGKIPFGGPVFAEAAADIYAATAGALGLARKLIVLDLDNTLWGGIVGDDGWEHLELGGTSPIGEAFATFQRVLKTLQRRGVLLAICSKNEETTALEAIDRHPEMLLRRADFVGWRINWQDKARNLGELVDELNLGLKAVVFIDDSPAERARVREAWPDVLVPDWPSDPAQYAATLRQLRCFDRPQLTHEDRRRTQSYVAERERRAVAQSTSSFDEWLQRLELRVTASELTAADLPRATQLINKTNQFNLITRRLSEEDLRTLAEQPGRHVFTYRVCDRFGDYGLTAVATLRFEPPTATLMDFVMSCRVMGRRVEHAVMRHVETVAARLGCATIVGQYIATERNQPCASFLPDCGFVQQSDDTWRKSLQGARADEPAVVAMVENA